MRIKEIMGRFCGTEFLGDTKFFQDILFKRWEEAGELTAADSERERVRPV